METIRGISKVVSAWTLESKTMLPKTPKDIEIYLKSGIAVIVKGDNDSPIGFGAITFDWPEDWKELGAIVVDPKFRKQGIGHLVVTKLIEKARGVHPTSRLFALCNEKSIKLFMDNGATEIKDPNLLPDEVWSACTTCPMVVEAKKNGKLCCDTPVEIR